MVDLQQRISNEDDVRKRTSDLAKIELQQQHIDDEPNVIKPRGLGQRHVQVLLLFTGLLLAYALRVNLSIGIVAMVDSSSNPEFEEFDWNESTRGLVLSSFFWGYILSQVPAGQLAERYGAKILLMIALSVCALLTLLTPVAAGWGWEYLCADRFIQGLAQGAIYPSVHTMLPRWVHPSERGMLSTFAYSGTQLGTVIMLGVSGFIAASTLGWPGIFYISGGLTAIWSILFAFLGCDSPAASKGISKEEKDFIESAKGVLTKGEKRVTPWKQIFTSKAFWAILVVHCTQSWGFWTLLTEIPLYMKDILEYDIKANALLSAMPYLVMWVLCIACSEISDFLMNRKYVSIGTGRKIFNTIGHWVPAASMLGLGYVTKDQSTLAVVLLTISVALNSATYVGFLINHMDVSPNFAGTLMGLTNGLSNIMSLLAPIFVGYIVTDATDPALWRIVFFVAAGLFFFGNGVFIVLGSGEIQPWNSMENLTLTENEADVTKTPDRNSSNVATNTK